MLLGQVGQVVTLMFTQRRYGFGRHGWRDFFSLGFFAQLLLSSEWNFAANIDEREKICQKYVRSLAEATMDLKQFNRV